MLLDLGRNDLGRVCRDGTVQVDQQMVIEKYSHVQHIVSNVRGATASQTRISLTCCGHVSRRGRSRGAPKVRAMEIIDELEPTRRGPYGGSDRLLQLLRQHGYRHHHPHHRVHQRHRPPAGGAGIVADSVPHAEYKETLSKAEALVQALKMAAAGFEVKTA